MIARADIESILEAGFPVAVSAAIERAAPFIRPAEAGVVIIARDFTRTGEDQIKTIPWRVAQRAMRRAGCRALRRPKRGALAFVIIGGQVAQRTIVGSAPAVDATVLKISRHPRYCPRVDEAPEHRAEPESQSNGRDLTLAAHTLYRAWVALCGAAHDDASRQLATDAGHLLDRAWVLCHAANDAEQKT